MTIGIGPPFVGRLIIGLFAVGLFAIGLLVGGGLMATSAAAQSPSEPVPCEVAMVVGCVATISGADGNVSLTLRVSETGGATVDPDAGAGVAPAADDSTETTPEIGAETTDQAGEEGESTLLTQPEQSDRPLQTTVDPWEQGGLKSNFGTGSIPISRYQIGADVTGWLGVPDPLDSFVASQTNWAFTTSTFMVLLATNALDWAFEFPLGESLVGDAGVLAQSYTVDFLGFGLTTSVYGLALSVTMVVAGFKALTKGLVAAGSEVVVAFFAYVLLVVLTLTSGFGNAGLMISRLSSDLSASIATFAAGSDRQEACALELQAYRSPTSLAGSTAEADGSALASANSSACSFGYAIQRSMVELPYQNLQWGQVLDGVAGKERCSAINLELLSEGPWGNDDEPRSRMRSASECEENADFNHQASYIRLGIASANALTTGAVTLLILVVAAMLLWQQIKLLFLTVTMPHALVMAILPGRARHLAWRWVELLVGVVVRTVILSLGLVVWLSLFSLIVYEQLTLRGIFLSLFASISMAVSGFWGLYKLSGMTRRRSPETGPAKTEAIAEGVGGRGGAGGGTTSGRSTGRGTGRSDGGGGQGGDSPGRPAGAQNRQSGTRRLVEGARATIRTVRAGDGGGSPSRSGGPGAAGGGRSGRPGGSSGGGRASSGDLGMVVDKIAGAVDRAQRTSDSTTPSTRSPLIDRPQRFSTFGGGPGDQPGGGAAAPTPGGPGQRRQRPGQQPRANADRSKQVEIGVGRP